MAMLRVLILYANPVATSYGAALHRRVIEGLQRSGHRIDDCDLYAEGSDPVMSPQERATYQDMAVNKAPVASHADRVLAAEALIPIYPVWNEGFPAILKGFFDRVFIPGVSLKMSPDDAIAPSLGELKKLAAVCTYGADRLTSFVLGDPPRRVVKRLLRATAGHHVSCEYIAHYDMNHTTPERREAFLNKVLHAFEAW
jgi:NAD(P)H dehydrogenase (quinone)